ncbi:MAG: hypothetical protein JSY10_08285 [Paenibacillus sp.]|nr:hypothetical protein [Paenibacillus sp.]
MGPPPRKGTYYGPSPDTLFKITHTPGKITLVDRAVTREVNPTHTEKLSRRGSALFQSLRRYGSRQNEESDTNSLSSPSSESSQATYFTSQSCNDLYYQSKPIHLERHPLQFICSVATRNLTNLHFEADTPEEKDIWCQHIESVLEEHVQRNQQVNNKEQELSPTNSTYSFESISSAESITFTPSWTGYCDVERMDIDDVEQQQQQQQQQQSTVISVKEETNNNELDKSQDLLQTIMGEFGDTIWNMGSPVGMSPYQLRQSFSNVGS